MRTDVTTSEQIKAIAQHLPCRIIHGAHGPYLSRYTLRELPDGGRVYLHFFHRGDADLELHNHPWAGESLIMTGGYVEERRVGDEILTRWYRPGDRNILGPETFHRVDLLAPDEGCWTLFTASAKVQSWGFWNRITNAFTPWREFVASARNHVRGGGAGG